MNDQRKVSVNIRPKILIVDDSAHNIQIMSGVLKPEYRILAAKTGVQALKLLQENEELPHLILLDILMPSLDGINLCKHIKSAPVLREIPVIFVTSLSEPESLVEGFEAGAVDYVTKPFIREELLQRVRVHVSLQQHKTELKNINSQQEDIIHGKTEELKFANHALQKTNEELETLLRKTKDLDHAKMAFLQLISHAIRTPLVSISGVKDLLKDEKRDDQYVEILSEAVERLQDFSDRALLITRLQTGDMVIQKVTTPVLEIIRDVLVQIKPFIQEKNLVIQNNIQPHFTLLVAPELFRIVIYQLLHNAVKFSQPGGKITVDLKPDEENPCLSIRDSGEGFPEPVLNQHFEIYTTSDHYSSRDLGLGLATVRLIMDAHEGNMEIRNFISGGAVVFLFFKI